MVGAGALSMKNDRYTPINEVAIDMTTASIRAWENWRVSKIAIAPGAINNEIDRIIPTDFSVATMVSAIIHSRP